MESSAPISIPASEPTASNASRDNIGGSTNSPQSVSSEGSEVRCGVSALSAALRNSNSMSELRVGSLPMHLRHPSKGGLIRRKCLLDSGSSQSMGPVSLPQPRAPFLSSREGPKEKLSSMPVVTLPKSAVSTNPTSQTYVQYGSLRESRYSLLNCTEGQQHRGEFFQPSTLPDRNYGGIGTFINGGGDQSCNSFSQKSVADHAFPAYDVKVIEEGCREINFMEDFEKSEQAVSYNAPNLEYEKNHQNCELPPLSNSLTAMDVLTRTKNCFGLHETVSSCGDITAEHNQRQQIENSDKPSPAPVDHMVNYDCSDQHANPDTFEAFDLELDG